ncbi:MAG: ribosome small subunit-dependent GTPase A [Clostridiales bacterium]|nr:ribosome small subunit-dependent GTPase A [Clostridiales bacterium]
MKGQVIRVHSDTFYVYDGENTISCRAKGNFKIKKDSLIVGDYVEFDENEKVITKICERKNLFIRPSVANVDQIFILIAPLPKPDFLLIDKLLVNAFRKDVKISIIINKSDLGADELYQETIEEYEESGIEIYKISSKDDKNLEFIKEKLKGNLTVLAGQSAVGKTSLVNALFGYSLKTGDLSEKINRGKHSTTYSNIYFVGDIKIIDTPGFAVIETEEFFKDEDIKDYYPEYVEASNFCKFRDCKHVNEPGCEVLRLIKEGKLSAVRHQRYLELLKENDERKKY